MTDRSTKTARPSLPVRPADSHKGNFGRILIVAGSANMAGAAALSGMSALRGGAGLVTVATAADCQSIVAGFQPSYMTVGLACRDGMIAANCLDQLGSFLDAADVVAIGPGLGRSDGVIRVVESIYRSAPQTVVCDADALFALSQIPHALPDHPGPRILTPHLGEFHRLVGSSLPIEAARNRAVEVARAWNCVLLLKGHRTQITDGEHTSTNFTGNPGMATGGCGDILTGLIAAFAGQGLSPFDATVLGAYAQGLAGDLAAEDLGQVALISSDLVDYLPAALSQCIAPDRAGDAGRD